MTIHRDPARTIRPTVTNIVATQTNRITETKCATVTAKVTEVVHATETKKTTVTVTVQPTAAPPAQTPSYPSYPTCPGSTGSGVSWAHYAGVDYSLESVSLEVSFARRFLTCRLTFHACNLPVLLVWLRLDADLCQRMQGQLV